MPPFRNSSASNQTRSLAAAVVVVAVALMATTTLAAPLNWTTTAQPSLPFGPQAETYAGSPNAAGWAAAADMVLTSSSTGIVALNATSGVVQWSSNEFSDALLLTVTNGNATTPPLVFAHGMFHCGLFNAATGSVLWSTTPANQPNPPLQPVLYGTTGIFALASAPVTVSYFTISGGFVANTYAPTDPQISVLAALPLQPAMDAVAVLTTDANDQQGTITTLAAYSPNGGAALWSQVLASDINTMQLNADASIIVGTQQVNDYTASAGLYLFSTANGTELRNATAIPGSQILTTALVSRGGVEYAAVICDEGYTVFQLPTLTQLGSMTLDCVNPVPACKFAGADAGGRWVYFASGSSVLQVSTDFDAATNNFTTVVTPLTSGIGIPAIPYSYAQLGDVIAVGFQSSVQNPLGMQLISASSGRFIGRMDYPEYQGMGTTGGVAVGSFFAVHVESSMTTVVYLNFFQSSSTQFPLTISELWATKLDSGDVVVGQGSGQIAYMSGTSVRWTVDVRDFGVGSTQMYSLSTIEPTATSSFLFVGAHGRIGVTNFLLALDISTGALSGSADIDGTCSSTTEPSALSMRGASSGSNAVFVAGATCMIFADATPTFTAAHAVHNITGVSADAGVAFVVAQGTMGAAIATITTYTMATATLTSTANIGAASVLPPSVLGDFVYVSLTNGTLVALWRSTLGVAWSANGLTSGGGNLGRAFGFNGRVYVATTRGAVFAFEVATTAIQAWQSQLIGPLTGLFDAVPAVSDDGIFVWSDNRAMYALDSKAPQAPLWNRTFHDSWGEDAASPVCNNVGVYGGMAISGCAALYVTDLYTGRLVMRNPTLTAPTVVSGPNIFSNWGITFQTLTFVKVLHPPGAPAPTYTAAPLPSGMTMPTNVPVPPGSSGGPVPPVPPTPTGTSAPVVTFGPVINGVYVYLTKPQSWNTVRGNIRDIACDINDCTGYGPDLDVYVIGLNDSYVVATQFSVSFNTSSYMYDFLGAPQVLLTSNDIASIAPAQTLPSIALRGSNQLQIVKRYTNWRGVSSSWQSFTTFRSNVMNLLYDSSNETDMTLLNATSVYDPVSQYYNTTYIVGLAYLTEQVEIANIDWVNAVDANLISDRYIVNASYYPNANADLDQSTANPFGNRVTISFLYDGYYYYSFDEVRDRLESQASWYDNEEPKNVYLPDWQAVLVKYSTRAFPNNRSMWQSFTISYPTAQQQAKLLALANRSHLGLSSYAEDVQVVLAPSPAPIQQNTPAPTRSGSKSGEIDVPVIAGAAAGGVVALLLVIFIASRRTPRRHASVAKVRGQEYEDNFFSMTVNKV